MNVLRPHQALATIVGVLAAIIAVCAYLVAANFWSFWPYGSEDGVVCTMEAKICPDGTGVGRTGPNCEFAACPGEIVYTNNQFGFQIALPQSWTGYTVVNQKEDIYDLTGATTTNNGVIAQFPIFRIRHPLSTLAVPRQDIPIMVFTTGQWRYILAGEYNVGAAPIPPSELAHNSRYVFALPARYNYAFPEGFEEVERILSGKPVTAFEPAWSQTSQSGISGIMLTGPTCPVVRVNDPSCNDKPYQGQFIVRKVSGGPEVARFSTDTNGRFEVILAPGTYTIEPVQHIGLGNQPQSVEVKAGIMSDITLTFDTGIR
ncbi:MAG: hypothetical protein AAB375_02085 [Patescibacteria group bacterium]